MFLELSIDKFLNTLLSFLFQNRVYCSIRSNWKFQCKYILRPSDQSSVGSYCGQSAPIILEYCPKKCFWPPPSSARPGIIFIHAIVCACAMKNSFSLFLLPTFLFFYLWFLSTMHHLELDILMENKNDVTPWDTPGKFFLNFFFLYSFVNF